MIYALLLVISQDTTAKNLAPPSLLCPIKYLYTLVRSS